MTRRGGRDGSSKNGFSSMMEVRDFLDLLRTFLTVSMESSKAVLSFLARTDFLDMVGFGSERLGGDVPEEESCDGSEEEVEWMKWVDKGFVGD